MSDTTLTVIIAAIPALIIAVANAILIVRQGWALAENTAKTAAVAVDVQTIKTQTNHLTSALVESTAKASGLEGHAAGLADAAASADAATAASAEDSMTARMARIEGILASRLATGLPKPDADGVIGHLVAPSGGESK